MDLVHHTERSRFKVGPDIHMAYRRTGVRGNPARDDRKRRVMAVRSVFCPGRADLYPVCAREIIQTDATTAEMVKLMENTYRM